MDNEGTVIIGQLNPLMALCTFADAMNNPNIAGSFGKFLYCVKNGRQILLGHHPEKIEISARIIYYHAVFISRENGRYKKQVGTWEELREYLKQGWVIGTDRREGIKICYADSGRNGRLVPEKVFVIEK